jgi:hypothetical protein
MGKGMTLKIKASADKIYDRIKGKHGLSIGYRISDASPYRHRTDGGDYGVYADNCDNETR